MADLESWTRVHAVGAVRPRQLVEEYGGFVPSRDRSRPGQSFVTINEWDVHVLTAGLGGEQP